MRCIGNSIPASVLVPQLATALLAHSPASKTTEPNLAAALADALEHPGQLVRAQLVLRGALAQNLSESDALALATAVEYFHLASLLYDDLPCMDNSLVRRGRPCLHRIHGEATTILTALALINRAYSLINGLLVQQPPAIGVMANACVELALGTGGILEGQARDLRYSEQKWLPREVLRIAAKKTGALFLLSVYFPAVFGSPNQKERRLLRALCIYWGLAYHIMDDLNDVLSTNIDTGKTSGRDHALNRPNLALAVGVPKAKYRLARLLTLAARILQQVSHDRRWIHLQSFHHTYFSNPINQKALLGARSAA
jgi:geranylgeranyl pyrophosphate synthase